MWFTTLTIRVWLCAVGAEKPDFHFNKVGEFYFSNCGKGKPNKLSNGFGVYDISNLRLLEPMLELVASCDD